MKRTTNKRTKNRPFLIIGGVVVVGVIAMCFTFYSSYQDKQKSKEVAQSFLSELKAKNTTELSKLINPNSLKQTDYTQKTVAKKYEAVFSGLNVQKIQTSSISIKKTKSNTYTLSYKLAMDTELGNLKDLTYKTTLKKVDGNYKVDWKPSLIFPGMTGNDKISVTTDEASRGTIVDQDGTPLATNQALDQLGVVPKELGTGAEKTKNIDAIAQKYQLEKSFIESQLKQSWVTDDSFVPLKTLYNEAYVALTGTTIGKKTVRYYPLKEASAQLIGYTSSATADDLKENAALNENSLVGRSGLEKTYEKKLQGTPGGKINILTSAGAIKDTLFSKDKKDGQTITLTIRSDIQQKSYEALQGKSGSTIVTNPTTGAVEALASSPSFDPNKFSLGISQADYNSYANNAAKPFLARYASRYAPGSTFKTITAAIGLDAGVTQPDKVRTINGLKWQKNSSWGDYQVTRVSDLSSVTMKTALIYSDNIYFAQEALEMGETTFRKGLDKFIFGEKLDLPIAMDAAQISNKKSFNSEILLADTAYGQGQLLLSPIQQATIYSVFSNQGTLVYPHLLKEEKTKTKKEVIKSTTANELKTDLVQVVADENGTAHSLYNSSATLAAKTGTAELKEKQDEKGKENSFLLAFDASNGKYLVVSSIEDYQTGESATVLAKPLVDYLETK
ncbi:penicillin-binding transpeptidase domain-containing protein [Vagococcus entomophilus]|uniref:Penicillin-binding protein n=1 Tax=Vagococcus entomophilus TaxID=1160095 RepID=A0A430AIW7_9ENTE|nr:penicillin-binding transpeptidase domain-containing protein [Vagococcus entomophilus]RSU07953.1 penicillin-binding protein [Vagococcus entomophilus]